MWQNLLLKRGNAEKQKSELSCEWERQKNLTYLYAIGCGAGWADLRPSSVLVCGSHGYTGVQDTFSTWYLQRFPGFSLPWVSLISLNESLKFFRDTGIFFFPLYGILEPKGCGKTTSHSHPMSATQSIPLLHCRALFYCCKVCSELQSLLLFLFPLTSLCPSSVWVY